MDRPHIKYRETNIDDVDTNSNSSDDDDDINETTAMMNSERDNIDDLGYGDNNTTNEPTTEDTQPNNANNGQISTAAEGATGYQRPDHQLLERAPSPGSPQHTERASSPSGATASPPAYDDPPTYEEAMEMRHGNSASHLESPPAEDLEWDHDEQIKPTKLSKPGDSTDNINSGAIELERVTVDPGPGGDGIEVGTPAVPTDGPEASVADTSFSTPSTVPRQPSMDQLQIMTFREEENHPETDDVDNSITSRFPSVKFREVNRRECSIYAISVLVAICAVLLIILLPLSFSYIEYYQFGMTKIRVSQVVEYAKEIYDMGRYAIGPGKTFKRYPATAHHVSYKTIGLFTTDRIILEASISFQYFIKQDELGLIEQKYDSSYTDTIKSVAEAAFKNKAATYSTKEYFSERGKVERGIHDAIRLKLGGNCCADRDECIRLGTCHLCSANQTLCNKGYHIDVRYFQLKQLFIPPELTQKQLNVQLILEGNEKAVHVQKYQVYKKGTEAETESILNNANEVTKNATAQARLIVKQGNTTANALKESAHSRGLKLLYETLNIGCDEHKASLHWLRTLERHQRLVSGMSFKDYVALIQGLTDDD